MMAKDFWLQVSVGHHVETASLSSLVSVSPPESPPVLATLWQRLGPRALEGREPLQPLLRYRVDRHGYHVYRAGYDRQEGT